MGTAKTYLFLLGILCGLLVPQISLCNTPWTYDPKAKIESVYDLLELNWSMQEAGLFPFRTNSAKLTEEFGPIEQIYADTKYRRSVMVISGIQTKKQLDPLPLRKGILINTKLGRVGLALIFIGWTHHEIQDWHRNFTGTRAGLNFKALPSRQAAKLLLFGYMPKACAADAPLCELPNPAVSLSTSAGQLNQEVAEAEGAMSLGRCMSLGQKGAANVIALPAKIVKEGIEFVGDLISFEAWTKWYNSAAEMGSNVTEFLFDINNRVNNSMKTFKSIDPELYKVFGCVLGGQLAALVPLALAGVGTWRILKELGVVAAVVESMGPFLATLSNLVRTGKLAAQETAGAIAKYLDSAAFRALVSASKSQPAQLATLAVKCTL